jgi:hypothetical protein
MSRLLGFAVGHRDLLSGAFCAVRRRTLSLMLSFYGGGGFRRKCHPQQQRDRCARDCGSIFV